MAFEATFAQSTADLRSDAEDNLRYHFPYMKDETRNRILDVLQSQLGAELIQQKPEMEETLARSGLFSLSAELRNNIYELVLVEHEDIYVEDGDEYGYSWVENDDEEDEDGPVRRSVRELVQQHDPEPIPALLHVNQQVRAEAAPIYYGLNKFHAYFERPYGEPLTPTRKSLIDWLNIIGPKQAAMVKRVVIGLGPPGSAGSMVSNHVRDVVMDHRRRKSAVPSRRECLLQSYIPPHSRLPGDAIDFVYQSSYIEEKEPEDLLAAAEKQDIAALPKKMQFLEDMRRWDREAREKGDKPPPDDEAIERWERTDAEYLTWHFSIW